MQNLGQKNSYLYVKKYTIKIHQKNTSILIHHFKHPVIQLRLFYIVQI